MRRPEAAHGPVLLGRGLLLRLGQRVRVRVVLLAEGRAKRTLASHTASRVVVVHGSQGHPSEGRRGGLAC